MAARRTPMAVRFDPFEGKRPRTPIMPVPVFRLGHCGRAKRSPARRRCNRPGLGVAMMFLTVKRFLVSIIGAGALTVGGAVAATPAPAQPVFQEGLVNVNLTDVNAQIPIALAANICDVNVAVLVSDLQDDAANCTADSDADADITTGNGGGPVTQQGLVNVNIQDVTVQVPIAIAANICDVNVAVLVDTFLDEAADCNADANSTAFVTS